MFVKDYMTRHPITIEPEKRAVVAQQLMAESRIRHLPVVGDGKRVLGLVTQQRLQIAPDRLSSLNVWEITRMLSDLIVEQVMVKGKDLRTIGPEATLEAAAGLMMAHHVGSLLVIDDGVLVGIITEVDLLEALRNLLGANVSGWRVTMRVPDRDGEVSRLTSTILGRGWGVMALGSVRAPKSDDRWDIVLKIEGCPEGELKSALESIEDQELIDLREETVYTALA